MLPELGRHEQAMAAALEATDLYRPLAATALKLLRRIWRRLSTIWPTPCRSWARDEALAAAREATDLYRELAAARPEAFRPIWPCRSTISPPGCPSSGVARRRARRRKRRPISIAFSPRCAPEAFTPNLAVSLNTLSYVLWGLGRRAEALVAAVEAQALSRRSVSGKMIRGSRELWRASGIFSTNSDAGTELSHCDGRK